MALVRVIKSSRADVIEKSNAIASKLADALPRSMIDQTLTPPALSSSSTTGATAPPHPSSSASNPKPTKSHAQVISDLFDIMPTQLRDELAASLAEMYYLSDTDAGSIDEEMNNTSYHGQDKDSESAGKENMPKVCMSCLITNTLLICNCAYRGRTRWTTFLRRNRKVLTKKYIIHVTMDGTRTRNALAKKTCRRCACRRVLSYRTYH
jgi:hypothetical protein